MKKLTKVFAGIALILILALLGGYIYLRSYAPKLKGSLVVQNLSAPVETYFDEYGIPHIYASNAEDAYRAFGYIHAQDRIFQMELMRRVGLGRLAEIFGSELAGTDAFFRTLGTHRKAREDANQFGQLPQDLQTSTLAYLDGVNQFIASGKLPLEYKLIGITPEAYTVEDLYAISAYMAYSFAFALRTDPVVEQMKNTLDSTYFEALDMGFAELAPLGDSTTMAVGGPVAQLSGPKLIDALPVPAFHGSNSWAISGARSATGRVLHANDTHIKFAAPCVWYEAHIEYPGFSVYGDFLAGIPFALIGHSRSHAWGVTMFEDDDSDFFYEKFAHPDSSATITGDSLTAPVVKYREVILVKDAPDSTFMVYETANGPLVNAFLPVKSDTPVSMYWTYTHIPNQLLEAFAGLNTAKNIDEFREGVAKIGSPGLNITYGDASGNIAIWSAGKLVERPVDINGKYFARGFEPEDAFKGYYTFDHNPQTINPTSGYVRTANESHPSTDGSVYPGYYVPDTRADLIARLLDENTEMTVNGMKALMMDNTSKTEEEIAIEIALVLKLSGADFDATETSALAKLSTWKGTHNLEDIAPTIYYAVLYELVRGAMYDELGEEAFTSFLTTHLFYRSYPKLIFLGESPWWDDVSTLDIVETKEDVIVSAYHTAIAQLVKTYGKNLNYWEWARTHTLEHPHPLGTVAALRPFFNVGPFPAPGGVETINNAGFTPNGSGKYEVSFGPAMRNIVDFEDVENSWSVLPTGNSGNIMSPHYDDQALLFVQGGFRKMKMNEIEIKSGKNLLILKPE